MSWLWQQRGCLFHSNMLETQKASQIFVIISVIYFVYFHQLKQFQWSNFWKLLFCLTVVAFFICLYCCCKYCHFVTKLLVSYLPFGVWKLILYTSFLWNCVLLYMQSAVWSSCQPHFSMENKEYLLGNKTLHYIYISLWGPQTLWGPRQLYISPVGQVSPGCCTCWPRYILIFIVAITLPWVHK